MRQVEVEMELARNHSTLSFDPYQQHIKSNVGFKKEEGRVVKRVTHYHCQRTAPVIMLARELAFKSKLKFSHQKFIIDRSLAILYAFSHFRAEVLMHKQRDG